MKSTPLPVLRWDTAEVAPLYFHSGAGPDVSFLSNFCKAPFRIGGIEFSCVEQFFQWTKMTRYGRTEVADRILAATHPPSMKALARRGKGARLSESELADWNNISLEVMREAVAAKFDQNPELKAKLLVTEGATLVERLPGRMSDRLWGVSSTDNTGRNQLGVVLMDFRTLLIEDE
jgi:hypothetical protein